VPEDDYELLPHAELDFLRKEVDRLKRNPLGDTQASVSLLESMNTLNANVAKLVAIFQSASDDMSRLQHDQNALEQLRRLREENAKIAHGIVALSEMLKNTEPMEPVEPPRERMIPSPASYGGQYEEHEALDEPVEEQNPFMDEPTPPFPPSGDMDQFTGEPLPPPPRR